MKQNLANRLAAGGVWAAYTAQLCVESVRQMREYDVPNPVVNLSDTQVFIHAGINAFNLFLNVNMDNVAMNVEVNVGPDPTYADKYGVPITKDQWLELQRGPSYKQVDLWRNGIESVYTVWTGCDTSGCTPPHIFATAVVRFEDGIPEVQRTFRTTCLADAREAHRQVIELIRHGRL